MSAVKPFVPLLCSLLFLFSGEAADIPRIRHVKVSPASDPAVWESSDRLTRFTRVMDFSLAVDRSEAGILFDDANLYVRMRGSFDPAQPEGPAGASLGASDNFEFFIQPDPASGGYFHVMIDIHGRTYIEKTAAELKESGVKSAVRKEKDSWTAELTIPFSDIGIDAPREDRRVRVAVMRNNVRVDENQVFLRRRREVSSWTPNRYDYGDPTKWGDAVMTRTVSAPASVASGDLGYRVNLLQNPEFDVPGRCWSFSGGARRRETMPMSRRWICAVRGKAYAFLTARPKEMKAGETYTLAVRARSVGPSPCALQVVELVKGPDGRQREGTYVTGNLALTGEFRDYYVTFRAAAAEPLALVFYKLGAKDPESGIDLDFAGLYRGRISAFEIRRKPRAGRHQVIPGTEVKPSPNPYGKLPRPLKVLALASRHSRLREASEIFAGTGAEVDVLELTGVDNDVYLAADDPDVIERRLAKGEYGLFLVPRDGAVKIGRELAARIVSAAGKGAGVYLERQKNPGRLAGITGRVVRVTHAAAQHDYLVRRGSARYGTDDFPFSDYDRPAVLADAVRAAFGEPPVPADAVVRTDSAVYAGTRFTVRRKCAGDVTYRWSCEETPVTGARLGAFSDDGSLSSVEIAGHVPGVTLKWTFSDFSGRVLARGSGTGPRVEFTVPRGLLYTNQGTVRFRLVSSGGKLLDARTEAVYVRGNDRRRLHDDFTPSVWPFNSNTSYDSYPEALRQLERIGIRATMMPVTSGNIPPLIMRSGFGTGGDFIATSAVIADHRESPLREPPINDPAYRAKMAETAAKRAASVSAYGLIQGTIYDEPGLTGHGTGAEPDVSPGNVAVYRERMRAKYGTIGEYNRRHRTSHASFGDLGPVFIADARSSGEYAEYIEWRSFNNDRWCEVVSNLVHAARREDPDLAVSLCNSFGQTAFSGNDYWKLLTRTGLGFSNEYTAMVYFGRNPVLNFDEFYRSFRPDMRVWGFTGYYFTPERMSFMPWWFAAHRYGGFTWYAAGPGGFSILDVPTWSFTVDAVELQRVLRGSRLMDGVGKVLTCWRWAPSAIAVAYSHESMLLATARGKEVRDGEVHAGSPLHDFHHSRQGARYMLEELLFQYDFVSPEQMSRGGLSRYKVLFMPRITALDASAVAAVGKFVKSGGIVIADVQPAGCDELGVPRGSAPLAGCRGVFVTGKNFDEGDAAMRSRIRELVMSSGAAPVLHRTDGGFLPGREAMRHVSGAADVYTVLRMPGRSNDTEEETFGFAKKGFVYDVRARKFLGKTDRVRAAVPLADAAVFAVLPVPVRRIEVSGLPERVRAGETLELSFSLPDFAACSRDDMPAMALNVEFRPPDGRGRFHFSRNLLTSGGSAGLDFATAFNDPRGTWTLTVTEPLTGVSVSRRFDLE